MQATATKRPVNLVASASPVKSPARRAAPRRPGERWSSSTPGSASEAKATPSASFPSIVPVSWLQGRKSASATRHGARPEREAARDEQAVEHDGRRQDGEHGDGAKPRAERRRAQGSQGEPDGRRQQVVRRRVEGRPPLQGVREPMLLEDGEDVSRVPPGVVTGQGCHADRVPGVQREGEQKQARDHARRVVDGARLSRLFALGHPPGIILQHELRRLEASRRAARMDGDGRDGRLPRA